MNIMELSNILKQTTSLSDSQIKELTNIIMDYDEAEELLYQAIGMLNSDMTFETIKSDFETEKFFWKATPYKKYRNARTMKDNALKNPPEVREGELECPKCKQKKTLVVEMQTRSADEGFTYFIHCLNENCRAITK